MDLHHGKGAGGGGWGATLGAGSRGVMKAAGGKFDWFNYIVIVFIFSWQLKDYWHFHLMFLY